jgi:uncharacterized protein YcbK (DUF882 family)
MIIFIIFIIFIVEDVVFVSTRAKRIENAKQFLKENLIEIIACAARIYDLTEITLYNSIKRQKDEAEKTSVSRRERHNKKLSQNETNALHDLIKSLLMSDISSTHSLLFEVICFLKRAKESILSTSR